MRDHGGWRSILDLGVGDDPTAMPLRRCTRLVMFSTRDRQNGSLVRSA